MIVIKRYMMVMNLQQMEILDQQDWQQKLMFQQEQLIQQQRKLL